MIQIDEINRFLQAELKRSKRKSVGAVEAAVWLDSAGILEDSSSKPGLPLRKLLRDQQIDGQRQEVNHRWFVDSL